MASGGLIYRKDRFRRLKVVKGGYTHTHRQQGDLISLILFFENKGSGLEVISIIHATDMNLRLSRGAVLRGVDDFLLYIFLIMCGSIKKNKFFTGPCRLGSASHV
jgi:hypothetical protein